MPETTKAYALYGEHMGEINVLTGQMIAGDLPRKALELVREWLPAHKDELQRMWDTQTIEKLPPPG